MGPDWLPGSALRLFRRARKKLIVDGARNSKNFCRVRFWHRGTVLAPAPKNRHRQFAIQNGKCKPRNSTNGTKPVFGRTKRSQKIPFKVCGKHSKSGPDTPTPTASPDFAATQLLGNRSDDDEIFYEVPYFSTANTMPLIAASASQPFGTGCGHRRKKICKKRNVVFDAQ